MRRRRARLAAQQVAVLEEQPGWQWDLRDANWHIGLRALAAFKTAHGHAQVPRGYVTASGDPLGKWLDNQKSALRAGTLSAQRRQALTALDPRWFRPTKPVRLKGAPVDPIQTYGQHLDVITSPATPPRRGGTSMKSLKEA